MKTWTEKPQKPRKYERNHLDKITKSIRTCSYTRKFSIQNPKKNHQSLQIISYQNSKVRNSKPVRKSANSTFQWENHNPKTQNSKYRQDRTNPSANPNLIFRIRSKSQTKLIKPYATKISTFRNKNEDRKGHIFKEPKRAKQTHQQIHIWYQNPKQNLAQNQAKINFSKSKSPKLGKPTHHLPKIQPTHNKKMRTWSPNNRLAPNQHKHTN